MSLPLSFWITLWKIVLIGGLILFGSMAVWVTIGGAFDIRRLFQRIIQSHEQEKTQKSHDEERTQQT
jgi:Sec-independent protein translocase protein TatA